jgi:hypothetical protein
LQDTEEKPLYANNQRKVCGEQPLQQNVVFDPWNNHDLNQIRKDVWWDTDSDVEHIRDHHKDEQHARPAFSFKLYRFPLTQVFCGLQG